MKPNFCSFFPDRFLNKDWSKSCQKHDHSYALIRKDLEKAKKYLLSAKEKRLLADRQLLLDVAVTGHPILAKIMYLPVRLFGWFALI